MSLPEPNAINCIECGTLTYEDFPTVDTECPVCLERGREDVWIHDVVTVLDCPNGEDGCSSDFCNYRGQHIVREDERDLWEQEAMPVGALPPARPKSCRECPWREASAPGWLGPWTAEEWLALAHSDQPIACHLSIEIQDVWTPNTRQCAGAASYRKVVGKSPRDREVAVGPIQEGCFTRRDDFLAHHKATVET